jgi:hypothetical protein
MIRIALVAGVALPLAACARPAPSGPAEPTCGERSCAPVRAAYISHFTGQACTGTESYFTGYFGYDGVRRSWDGKGIVGTRLHPMTNRSWRDERGTCHDDWPAGNTLPDFVTVYR